MENKLYAYWLCSVPGVGNRTIEKLQKIFGTAEQIYHATEEEWAHVLKASQLEEMKQHLMVALARGCCRNVSREEVHQLIDEIYDEYKVGR